MAESKPNPTETEGAEIEASPAPPPGRTWLFKLATRRWLGIFLGVSLLTHGVVLVCYGLSTGGSGAGLPPEVTLGEFTFTAEDESDSPVASAVFTVHLSLIAEVAQTAEQLLQVNKFRVQQDIEELLRQAHGGDFEDTDLGDLKHRLQEQISETLSARVIAQVIITDLQLGRAVPSEGADEEIPPNVPWVEAEPSS
ncbi:MAG: hypothetical protein HQ581_14625 [Planctomycetes bacterium]|nr:hypothetical protein [Planctomycetota bacterium]